MKSTTRNRKGTNQGLRRGRRALRHLLAGRREADQLGVVAEQAASAHLYAGKTDMYRSVRARGRNPFRHLEHVAWSDNPAARPASSITSTLKSGQAGVQTVHHPQGHRLRAERHAAPNTRDAEQEFNHGAVACRLTLSDASSYTRTACANWSAESRRSPLLRYSSSRLGRTSTPAPTIPITISSSSTANWFSHTTTTLRRGADQQCMVPKVRPILVRSAR